MIPAIPKWGIALLMASLSVCPLPAAEMFVRAPLAELLQEPSGTPVIQDSRQILQSLRKHCGRKALIELEDRHYFILTEEWIEKKQAWFAWLMDHLEIHPDQLQHQDFDGDNVARIWMTIAEAKISLHLDTPAQLPIGHIRMRSDAAWGPLQGDGAIHDFIICLTDKGFLILDPHHGQQAYLSEHPNRSSTIRILF